jgi:hypothetical protein
VIIYSVPSYALVDVSGDSAGSWIYVLVEDAEGKEYSAKSDALNYKDEYRTQYINMSNLLPLDNNQIYPLKYKGLHVRPHKRSDEGTIIVDRVRVIYPGWTSVEKNRDTGIPAQFHLKQNYPNPFNPVTQISYDLAESANISLDIFSVSGKYVLTLFSGYQPAGSYTLRFNAEELPTGIYYYRLTDGSHLQTKKMLLIK